MKKKIAVLMLSAVVLTAAGCGNQTEVAEEAAVQTESAAEAEDAASDSESVSAVSAEDDNQMIIEKTEADELDVEPETETASLESKISGMDTVVASVSPDDEEAIQEALAGIEEGTVNYSTGLHEVQILTSSDPSLTEDGLQASVAEGLKEAELGSVIGADNRIEVPEEYRTGYPFSTIVLLEMTFSDGSTFDCSGAMIGPDTVLTSAYNLLEPSKGGFPESIIAIPAYSNTGTAAPFGYAYAVDCGVTSNFYNSAMRQTREDWYLYTDYAYDYGYVKLDSNLGDRTGCLGINYTNSGLNGITVSAIGYNQEVAMVGAEEEITESESDFLYYSMDVDSIMVGAPLIMDDYGIVGLASSLTASNGKNIGVLFDESDAIWIANIIYQ
ncbi:MAG: hypothetical protein Q4B03_00725 [Lachnospiraceae bacterium]|nr:hypothetical protein [Lachnospiraceae bacterium]